MSIKRPKTYGEWYWAQGFEAALAEQESYEKELAPVAADIIKGLNISEFLPESLSSLFSNLQSPKAAAWGAILGRFGSEVADGVVGDALGHALKDFNYKMAEWFGDLRINAATASLLWTRKKISEAMYDKRMLSEGYKPEESAAFFESLRPYPTIPEIMSWARYHGDYDNIRGTVWEKYNVSEDDFPMWEWLSWQKLTTIQAQTLLKRGAMTEGDFYGEIGRIGWHTVDRDSIRDLSYILPNSMLMIQGGLIQGLGEDRILENISRGDIHPDWAETYKDAVLTKPASQDIVAYELRQDPTLSRLDDELRTIGIHPKYTEIYKELAYQIPPVADIITMAVREAFTPEIASKFGQYQDFPADLEKYGAMKGLSKEWTQRYWAAHWALPSPQQGFEMLHRGVIDFSELNMLLRAQDVMPFWRNKLIQIAYRRLTRVDVRRMYKQGVLTEREVFESYQNQGYDDKNAERMAEFTVRQTLATLSKFTSGDIIKAFAKRMIDRSEAMSLLSGIGIRTEDAKYIISTAEYKRIWEFTDSQISGIRNLFKKRVYDENQARDKLARLNLPADQITVLMQQWYYEKAEELDTTWTTAQVLRFLKRKLITTERAKRELYLHGYDAEHSDILIRNMQWTPPTE